MDFITIFGVVAGVASIIGLFSYTYKKVSRTRNDDSVKRNKQIIKKGSNNMQAGRDMNSGNK